MSGMDINVKKIGKEYKVEFSHNSQLFLLDYSSNDKNEAEWIKNQLQKCFDSAFGQMLIAFYSDLKEQVGTYKIESIETEKAVNVFLKRNL